MDEAYAVLKYIWPILALPLGWLWHRLNKAHTRIDAAKDATKAVEAALNAHILDVAKNHFDKNEVRQIISETTVPIFQQLTEIKTDVHELLQRERERK